MPEILSLYELNRLIRSVIDEAFHAAVLVTAEIASCDVKNHCYMTLVDRDGETTRAEIKAVIWANSYKVISRQFREATGVDPGKGIKILFEAEVSFHERYGLKLNILNIDPSFTIGEFAVRRKEILERLAKEGLKDRNKGLEFPLVPRRVGIISSATAAGYEDLLNHLSNNPYGYRFTCRLYEAVMQGDGAEASVVRAFRQCLNDASSLDVAVIVRGGGGQADLHCFDSYEIAKAIASMPIPVISGIGHERDFTVVDEVSNMRAKTPTAVADMIITRVKDFEDTIDTLRNSLVHGARRLTSEAKEEISSLAKNLENHIRKDINDNEHRLDFFLKGLKYSLRSIQSEHEKLRARESSVKHLDPLNVLKRGYSITYSNGKPLKSASDVEEGDNVRTKLFKGGFTSIVERKTDREVSK
ncbi:MAG: exodeoxyribonuclease VII large subunit [Nitrospiraceae bacterium]|nr:MAG: exodeoxyribonuclease VII large subunit [Nitrospiraceae bacterium]